MTTQRKIDIAVVGVVDDVVVFVMLEKLCMWGPLVEDCAIWSF